MKKEETLNFNFLHKAKEMYIQHESDLEHKLSYFTREQQLYHEGIGVGIKKMIQLYEKTNDVEVKVQKMPGYYLSIDSWINDGDDHTSNTISGSKEYLNEVIEFLEQYCGPKRSSDCNNLGNLTDDDSISDQTIIEVTQFILSKKNIVNEYFYKKEDIHAIDLRNLLENQNYQKLSDYIIEFISDLLGYSEYYQTRVYDSHYMYFLKDPIIHQILKN